MPINQYQYGTLIKTTHAERGSFLGMDDACHESSHAAIDEARAFYHDEGRQSLAGYKYKLISIFRLDILTGETSTFLTRKQLIDIFENEPDEDFDPKEQAVIDAHNLRHDATL